MAHQFHPCVFTHISLLILGVTLQHCRPHTAGDSHRDAAQTPNSSTGNEAPSSSALSSPDPRPDPLADGPAWCLDLKPLPPNPDLDERSLRFLCIQPSMTQDQVRRLLGPPDQVTTRPGRDGMAEVTWRYQASGPKVGELVGYVAFGPSNEVTAIQTPIPITDPIVHRTTGAAVSPEGMHCLLRGVAWSGDAVHARVVLSNKGKKEFRFQHDHTAIKFNLLVSIYDDHDVLLGRQDWHLLHSPYGDLVDLVIAPGSELGEDVTLPPMSEGQIIHLAPGRYSLEVAFPFHGQEYYGSGRVPFVVPGSSPKPPPP